MIPSTQARVLVAVAALVLIATAVYHATAYTEVTSAVAVPGISRFVRRALPGLWFFLSWHLLELAAAASWAALRGVPSARPLVIFCGAVMAADTAFIFSLAGVFPGTLMLAAAAVCLVVGALRWPAP